MATVVGVFNTINEAQDAKSDLVARGYAAQNINVVANEESAGQAKLAHAGHATAGSSESGIGDKISGFFRSLTSTPSEDEDYYAETVGKGGALIAVTVPEDQADEVADLLEDYGAEEVDEQDIDKQALKSKSTARVGDATAPTSIPVVEEELTVGKREVRRGGVRVYSQVIEQPVEADVQLREEHIHIERRPVDRPATEADLNMGRDQVIELTETAEEAVVGKTKRVVEEVLVGKETTARTQTVRDTVRKTEVRVENVGKEATSATGFSDYEPEFRKDFQSNYGKTGASYDTYAPAYQYGYKLANDPRYIDSDYSSVESQAKTDWSREGKGSWEQFKDAIRSGWDRVRGH